MMGGLVPDDAAHEDGKNRRLRRHADEDADAVSPVVQRLERAGVNIWVGFDLARGEGERRAARAQVRADLSHEGHARGGVVFQVEELFRCVGKRHEKRPVKRNDLQVGTIQRGEERQRVCHAWVVGQGQKRGSRHEVRAKDAQVADVARQGQAGGVGQAARADGRVKVEHAHGEGPRGAEEESAQRPREERTIFPAEGGDEIVEVDAGKKV